MDTLGSRQKTKPLKGLPAVATTTNECINVDELHKTVLFGRFDTDAEADEDMFEIDGDIHMEMSICSKTSLTTVCSAFPLNDRIHFDSDSKQMEPGCEIHKKNSVVTGGALCLLDANDDIEYDVEAQVVPPKSCWC